MDLMEAVMTGPNEKVAFSERDMRKTRGSMGALLDLIRSTVRPVLIGPDRFDRIVEAGDRLPDLITPHFVFECRLGRSMQRVDLEVCIDLKLKGKRLIDHLQRGNTWTCGSYDTVPAPFLEAWSENRHQLQDLVSHLWLEMNLCDSSMVSGPPGVFFSPEPALSRRFPNTGRSAPTGGLMDATDRVMESLRGGGFVRSYQASYRKILDSLPLGARVFQVGAMDLAPGPSLKVYVSHLDAPELCPFLERIGWPGEILRVDGLLDRLSAPSRTVALGLDICGSLSHRLGVELYLADDFESLRALSATLVAMDLCEAEKARALETYPSVLREREIEEWPLFLKRLAVFLKREKEGIIRKRINHFKVVVETDRPIEAKVYLSAFQTWEMQ